MTTLNAYDELPYKSKPIEWTAPERLALASLLHGGPRARLGEYRVLELGCADGANLLPMAYFRPNASFVGIDNAESQITIANKRKGALGVENVEFMSVDFHDADRFLCGEFDFIIAHGVFSWIPDAARDAMLDLCARHLSRDGLFYLNYNTYPGWKVRGLVRRLLLTGTNTGAGLGERALLAQHIAAELATSLAASIESSPHPFTQLLAKELKFVSEHHHSYVAHEYLAADNHAYWRSEFLRLVRDYGFDYVADADFSYPSSRGSLSSGSPNIHDESLNGEVDADTADLLCYRQLHSPILCLKPSVPRPPTNDELSNLTIASCLIACTGNDGNEDMFWHPSGYTVEAKEDAIGAAFVRLLPLWPLGVRIADLFSEVATATVIDDLKLLHRNGLIEMRCPPPRESFGSSELLNRMEAAYGDYVTTPYHTREAVPAHWVAGSSTVTAAEP